MGDGGSHRDDCDFEMMEMATATTETTTAATETMVTLK